MANKTKAEERAAANDPAVPRAVSARHRAPAWMFDAAAETMPREELARLQLRRLRATLKNAWEHVPLHRARLRDAGFAPGALHSLEDLARLPFTVKADLRDHYPFGMLARPREEMQRLHATSGTASKPTVVGYTRKDIATWADLMARSLAAAGARPGDAIHNAYGYGLFTGGLGVHYGAERLGATVVPVSGGATDRQVVLLQDFGARMLCATPSYALAIAEAAEAAGVDLRRSKLAFGLFGAEPWSEAMRHEIEVRLGLKAVDLYGLSEIMGPGVACECEAAQAGLHGWEDHFLFEVIDPVTGQPVPEGERGELVITTLTRQAMPMVRYRTRDITRITTEPCACGRTHLRLRRITGRNDDVLIIRGVNVYPSQIEAALIGLPGIAPHYQLVVTREASLDLLTVEVESVAVLNSLETMRRLAGAVRQQIKSMIGISAIVEIKPPGDIPRSQGTAVRVRDLRPKQH